MPATALRCRVCETEYPLEPDRRLLAAASGRSTRSTTASASAARRHPRVDRGGAALDLALRRPAARRAAGGAARSRPGWTPLVPAPRLAAELGLGELWLKLDTANPTHSFKDRVVAVAPRRRASSASTTLACSSTGNLANAVAARAAADGLDAAVFCPADLEPEKLVATSVYGATIYAVDGSYDDCSRLTVELSFELDWAFVNVGCARTTRRARRRSRSRSPSSSAGALPDAVVAPIASGALFSKLHQGFARAARARARRRRRRRGSTAARRRAARRSRPPSPRAAGHAGPPGHDRALARDRQPGRRRPRASRPRARRAARSTPCPRTRSRANIGAARADDRRLRRDGAGRHVRRAAGRRSRAARSAATTASCCSSPATA